ncbi:DegV family protein [Bacillus tianshenii]|nr:DegV family protein [Bacillus tianshenii]
MSVKIITDTGCDLSKEMMKELDITCLPFGVHIEGNDYLDGETITPTTLYNEMRAEKVAKTSQVSPAIFEETFTDIAKQEQSAIYLSFSADLSGTFQTAEMMKENVISQHPNLDVTVVNTKCASLGQGYIVKRAAEMAKAGKSKDEILQVVKALGEQMEHIFTVDSLEYLYRGGRISKTSAFVGGLLNIKPILHLEDGKLLPLEKIRGRKKLFRRLLELAEERAKNLDKQTVCITHAADEEAAQQVKEMFTEKFGTKDFIINEVGSAIGAHVGPGTVAVFFMNDAEE